MSFDYFYTATGEVKRIENFENDHLHYQKKNRLLDDEIVLEIDKNKLNFSDNKDKNEFIKHVLELIDKETNKYSYVMSFYGFIDRVDEEKYSVINYKYFKKYFYENEVDDEIALENINSIYFYFCTILLSLISKGRLKIISANKDITKTFYNLVKNFFDKFYSNLKTEIFIDNNFSFKCFCYFLFYKAGISDKFNYDIESNDTKTLYKLLKVLEEIKNDELFDDEENKKGNKFSIGFEDYGFYSVDDVFNYLLEVNY